jgi:hypothetical protein
MQFAMTSCVAILLSQIEVKLPGLEKGRVHLPLLREDQTRILNMRFSQKIVAAAALVAA